MSIGIGLLAAGAISAVSVLVAVLVEWRQTVLDRRHSEIVRRRGREINERTGAVMLLVLLAGGIAVAGFGWV